MTERRGTILAGLGIATLAAPMVAFALLRALPQLDPPVMWFTFHFYAVGVTALAAAVACAIIIASARTLRETRLLFLGLAFFSIAGIFAVHGLTTPGFIVDEYYASLAVSAWLSVLAGAAFVAMSVVGLPARVERLIESNGRALVGVAVATVIAYITLSFTVESWLDWAPIGGRSVQLSMGFASTGLLGFAAGRYYQAYVFARLPSQIAMVATLLLLLQVQTILLWSPVWHVSWWLYHSLYGVAFAVLFAGWAIEVRRSGSLRAIADALSMRNALAQLNRGLDAPILELVDAVEAKDVETFGHVRRVSGYALAIGRRMGLSSSELRSLVLAAEMHDVGKISIPGSLLAKPGPLTDEEYTVLKTHTVRGYEIAEKVTALRPLAGVIKAHHERFDGDGYPDGLAGEEIPQLSRIISVADTYDAMRSKRPYRDGVSHVEAMAELLRVRGSQLDPRCVDAFTAVFAESGTRLLDERAAA